MPVRIAQVSPYDWTHPGGVTNHIGQLAREFTRLGHSVRIVTPSSISAEALGEKNIVVVGKPVPIPTFGSVARITLSFHRAPQVRQLLAEEPFDIIHLHEPLVSALPITVLRFSQSINVGTFHAFGYKSRGYRSLRPWLRRWFRKLHGKIAVSRPAADLIGRYFPGYYNVIPNGIDPLAFSPKVAPIERYKDGKINILFVGRMEKRKGLPFLLSAYARIKWEHPEVRLIVVGPGKLDPVSERILGERPLQDVEIVGGVPFADLPRYYRTADIFCSPATGSESFGIVLLEAMATGAPIVASNIPGYASVIQDGQQGLLVNPKDDQALAAALVTLVNDPDLRARMGQQGLASAQDYSWTRVAARVMGYYERLLEARYPGRHPQEN